MSAQKAIRRLALVACAVFLGTAGCSDGDGGSPTAPRDPVDPADPDPPDPAAVLECEIEGYPCSPSGVDLQILERSDSLADRLVEMLDGGSTVDQAVVWLEDEPGVAEIEWDELAIRFRLEGGRAHWVFATGVTGALGSARVTPPRIDLARNVARDIVGPASKQKKALVLSPAFWEFGEFDDGPAVAGILAGTRGYENGVTFLSSAEPTSSSIGIAHFQSWDDYQVIHISSHGKRLCSPQGCRATITAGTVDGLFPGPGTTAEKLHQIALHGIEVVNSQASGYEYVLLAADFFRSQYPSGLDDTIVFFNACQSFGPQATDLVDAIQSSSSVVFGWTEAVFASDATITAIALYGHLSEGGYPAEIAYRKLEELQFGAPTNVGGGQPRLAISERPDGGDLRIRDVVQLLNPSTAQALASASLVAIDGVQSDGEEDAAPWLVQVDGVEPEFAEDMMVHVSVGDEEAEPVPLTTGQVNDSDQWTIQGSIPLGFDLESETQVTYRASANLHSGGESDDETVATLTGAEPIMGQTWEMDAVQVSAWEGNVPHTPYTATAHLVLTFEEGQDPNEPSPRYIITGGTVTYDYNHSYYDCTFSAPVITFDVTTEKTFDSVLVFDTGSDPVRYRGLIYTRGPSFTVSSQCEDSGSDRTHVASNVWFLFNPGEERSVDPDRRTISGTYRNEASNVGFYIETTYTLRRTK